MDAANDNQVAGDLLLGAGAISKFLGITARQTYRMVYDGIIPTFKLGGTVAARRSTLTVWMSEAEQGSAA
ncbi:DNA-binding protein [Pararhizobium sp.]|uniref:DNA-binding protein n=1 Tax=Pararhizobium sp. TaxID=1977563 RepID=UPI003D0A4E99